MAEVSVNGSGRLLPADQHDASVRQYDRTGERARIKSRGQFLHFHRGAWSAADVDSISGIAGEVRLLVVQLLVRLGTADPENLADIVENGVAIDRVGIVPALSCGLDRAFVAGVDPVHLCARPGMEDVAVAHREQPQMVVSAIDPGGIEPGNVRYRHAGQQGPAGFAGPDLGTLPATPAAPRAAQGECGTVGQQRVSLIAARHVHLCVEHPCIARGIVDARLAAAAAAVDENATVRQQGRSRTEHVCVGVGDHHFGWSCCRWIEQARVSLSLLRADVTLKLVRSIRGPHQQPAIGQVRHGDRIHRQRDALAQAEGNAAGASTPAMSNWSFKAASSWQPHWIAAAPTASEPPVMLTHLPLLRD